MTELLMLMAKSELIFCSRAPWLAKARFHQELRPDARCRRRFGGRASDFATSITVGLWPLRVLSTLTGRGIMAPTILKRS